MRTIKNSYTTSGGLRTPYPRPQAWTAAWLLATTLLPGGGGVPLEKPKPTRGAGLGECKHAAGSASALDAVGYLQTWSDVKVSAFEQQALLRSAGISTMPAVSSITKARAKARATFDDLQQQNPDLEEPYRQSMVNFGDAQYISYMIIGKQLIGGILDTGSFELVIFSTTCVSCGAAAEYNPWLSSSYGVGQLKTTQSYGSGDTFSEEAFDLVSIGPFPDTNQTFWEVTKANMPILYNAAFQCIIGVGPPETPAADAWTAIQKTASNISNLTDEHKPLPSALLTQVTDRLDVAMEVTRRPTLLRNFNVSMFSMCVGRKPGSDGYFVWNDYTALRQPSIFAEVPVIGTHTWSVQLNNVRVEGIRNPNNSSEDGSRQIGCAEGCSAIIDSGTSLLAVPGFIMTELQEMMDRMNSDCSNIRELPDLVFDMGDGEFHLPPDAYVAEVVGALPNYLEGYVNFKHGDMPYRPRSRCQLLLMESYAQTKFGPLWILGIPFFRKYYTTFKVGESRKDRSLFIAPASEDCYPQKEAYALTSASSEVDISLSELSSDPSDAYVRRVDATRVHLPELARKAAAEEFIHL